MLFSSSRFNFRDLGKRKVLANHGTSSTNDLIVLLVVSLAVASGIIWSLH